MSTKRPWKDFFIPEPARLTALQNDQNHLSRTLEACPTSGTLGGIPISSAEQVGRKAGCGFPSSLSCYNKSIHIMKKKFKTSDHFNARVQN